MHGITLTQAPADWEIIQRADGYGTVRLAGHFQVHPAAIEVGVEKVTPVVRVMREEDNSCVIPWTPLRADIRPDFTGTFSDTLKIPEGGLYRIDTSLETKSTTPGLTWLYRGDCVLHLGVGDVFLIAGQSNSAGYGRDAAYDPPRMDVHLFRNRSRWDLACHPMNESTDAGSLANEEMGVPGVSPYLAFGKHFADLSRCPVGLVQVSLGGSPMARWHPKTGDLYQNMLDKIARTGGRYAGVLWYQGCSDGEPEPAARYLEHFTEMLAALRAHLKYEIPFFTFQLNRFVDCTEDTAWGQIREAQRVAALTLPKVYILPAVGGPMSDGIHNSAHGNLRLGEKLAKQAAHYLLGTPAFEAPMIASARMEDALTLCLTFRNMALGFVCWSQKPEENGFSVTDGDGDVPVTAFRAVREDKNHIYLTLGRPLSGDARVSFAWEADPVRFPPMDEVTYLPPVGFYRYPVEQ